MGTCIFSDGSTLPKQHNLCVLEQMFEECLGFVFTKTLVISHNSRINLWKHCNFLSRHCQGLCRGTKPREGSMDLKGLWPQLQNRSWNISFLFRNLSKTRYLYKKQDSGACVGASLGNVQVLCLPVRHLLGQHWLCSCSGNYRGKHFGRLLKPRAARQRLLDHLLQSSMWCSTETWLPPWWVRISQGFQPVSLHACFYKSVLAFTSHHELCLWLHFPFTPPWKGLSHILGVPRAHHQGGAGSTGCHGATEDVSGWSSPEVAWWNLKKNINHSGSQRLLYLGSSS